MYPTQIPRLNAHASCRYTAAVPYHVSDTLSVLAENYQSQKYITRTAFELLAQITAAPNTVLNTNFSTAYPLGAYVHTCGITDPIPSSHHLRTAQTSESKVNSFARLKAFARSLFVKDQPLNVSAIKEKNANGIRTTAPDARFYWVKRIFDGDFNLGVLAFLGVKRGLLRGLYG